MCFNRRQDLHSCWSEVSAVIFTDLYLRCWKNNHTFVFVRHTSVQASSALDALHCTDIQRACSTSLQCLFSTGRHCLRPWQCLNGFHTHTSSVGDFRLLGFDLAANCQQFYIRCLRITDACISSIVTAGIEENVDCGLLKHTCMCSIHEWLENLSFY